MYKLSFDKLLSVYVLGIFTTTNSYAASMGSPESFAIYTAVVFIIFSSFIYLIGYSIAASKVNSGKSTSSSGYFAICVIIIALPVAATFAIPSLAIGSFFGVLVTSIIFNIAFNKLTRNAEKNILIKQKSEIHEPTTTDKLIDCVINNDINGVIEALNNNASPTEKDTNGYSAIDYARGHGYDEIHNILQKYITNRSSRDRRPAGPPAT